MMEGRASRSPLLCQGADAVIQANPYYSQVVSGEIDVQIASTRNPERSSSLIYFKAPLTNTGIVYVGGYETTLTAPSSDTDETTGFPLNPGDVSPPFCVGNLNLTAHIGTIAGDQLIYVIQR